MLDNKYEWMLVDKLASKIEIRIEEKIMMMLYPSEQGMQFGGTPNNSKQHSHNTLFGVIESHRGEVLPTI